MRPSSEIKKQLEEFLAALPEDGEKYAEVDFASKLQWEAWMGHKADLEKELKEALEREAQ